MAYYEVIVDAVNFVDRQGLPIMKSACDELGMVASPAHQHSPKVPLQLATNYADRWKKDLPCLISRASILHCFITLLLLTQLLVDSSSYSSFWVSSMNEQDMLL